MSAGAGSIAAGGAITGSALGDNSRVTYVDKQYVAQNEVPVGWLVVVGTVPVLACAFQPREVLRQAVDEARGHGRSVVLASDTPHGERSPSGTRASVQVMSGAAGWASRSWPPPTPVKQSKAAPAAGGGRRPSAHRDVEQGASDLRRAVTLPASSLDALADSVLSTCQEPRADDIALILALTKVFGRNQVVSWDIDNDPAVVSEARKHACERLADWGLRTSSSQNSSSVN